MKGGRKLKGEIFWKRIFLTEKGIFVNRESGNMFT